MQACDLDPNMLNVCAYRSVSDLSGALGEKRESRIYLKYISRLQTHNVPFKWERLARQRIPRDLVLKKCYIWSLYETLPLFYFGLLLKFRVKAHY